MPRCGSTKTSSLKENPNDVEEGQDFTANLNPKSLEVVDGAKLEPLAGQCPRSDRLPVRTAGLLLRGSGYQARSPGLQPHRSAERHLGENRKARQVTSRQNMIILGIGGTQGDAAAALLKDGELAAAVKSPNWSGAHHSRRHSAAAPSPPACELAGVKPDQVDAIAIVRPLPEGEFHLTLRAQFPQQPDRRGGASPGARRLGLLPFPVRRGHRAHPRPRRRFPLRLALERRRHPPLPRTRAILARLAGRSLRPRYRTPRLPVESRRAQGAVALVERRRSLQRPVPRDPLPERFRTALRPFVFQHRARAATAASARASTTVSG